MDTVSRGLSVIGGRTAGGNAGLADATGPEGGPAVRLFDRSGEARGDAAPLGEGFAGGLFVG